MPAYRPKNSLVIQHASGGIFIQRISCLNQQNITNHNPSISVYNCGLSVLELQNDQAPLWFWGVVVLMELCGQNLSSDSESDVNWR